MTDTSQRTGWPARPATRACMTCRRRKRQCDKQIPMCSSCRWLQTPCQYELPSSAYTTATVAAMQGQQAPLPWMRIEPSSTTSMIQDYATTLFGSAHRLDALLLQYFKRIHPWLPFVSRQRFYERLSGLSSSTDHSFVLLTCGMHLVLSIPPQVEVGSARSTNYMEIKRLLALAESQGPPVLDLVQCHLLVALYEINHGATDEAYLSLGNCSRAATVLGLDPMQWREDSQHRLWVQVEEKRRTWWAITILDRFLRLQRPNWPAAVRDPSSNDLLPMDDTEWDSLLYGPPSAPNLHMSQHDSSGGDPKAPVPVSTSSHVRVGYFARLAQVSHLLGLVLNNKFNPTPDCAFNAQETQQLRRTLAVYSELLPKEACAADCSHYCGPLAICHSARLILEQSGLETLSDMDTFRDYNPATDMLTAVAIDMAQQLNAELAGTDLELLRPLALRWIYIVAHIYIQQYQRDPDPKYKHGLRILLQSLTYFEQRWRLAVVYKATITSALELFSIRV